MSRRLVVISVSLLMRMFASLVLLVVLPSSLTILAQETTHEPNAPSPATRHTQVIAHGVTKMPDAEVGWRATTERALPPGRSTAEEQERFPGFLLAHDGAIALTDDHGVILTRIAPGEAAWVEVDEPYAVISLEKRSVEYITIALRPAANLGEGGLSLAIGLPFAAPPGEAFDVDLLRDALERNEEASISAGLTPSLLLLTQGAVWVTAGGGEAVQVTAGGIGQIEGDAVIAGGSRSPATFVVARIGPAVPARVRLKDARMATPIAGGTPAAMPETGTDRLWPEPTPADPTLDTDADGLTDGDESTLYGTEPRDSDTDDDGLDDASEMLLHGTNPFLADTDGDEVADSDEIDAGTDPLDAASFPETPTPAAATIPASDLSPASPVPEPGPEPEASPAVGEGLDPDGDFDGDGLSNADEITIYGADPTVVDTDGDGFSDGGEVVSGRNPLDPADG